VVKRSAGESCTGTFFPYVGSTPTCTFLARWAISAVFLNQGGDQFFGIVFFPDVLSLKSRNKELVVVNFVENLGDFHANALPGLQKNGSDG
jgi:hypothetical protein